MDVSLDTSAIINLYKSELKNTLFDRFEKIYVFEFIWNEELKRHGVEILQDFDSDVNAGKIHIITEDYLRNKHIYEIFKKHVEIMTYYIRRVIKAKSMLYLWH